jgi:cytochrome c oxidase subunit I+III
MEATPQYLLLMPGPAWTPILAAIFTAAFFLLLTVKLVVPSFACGVVATLLIIRWLWDTDPGPAYAPVDIGGGIRLPVYVTGPQSHSWWAIVVLILVSGSIFACLVFSYLFLWTTSPQLWPAVAALPALGYPFAAGALLALSSVAVGVAGRAIERGTVWPMRLALALAIPLATAAVSVELAGHWRAGWRPSESGYGALLYTIIGLQGLFVAVVATMVAYTLARSAAGLIDRVRRATLDNTTLLWHYTTAQGLSALALVHFFPRLLEVQG